MITMAEKEYIEKNHRINTIINSTALYNSTVLKLIKTEPTADVQEVRHGKWIYDGSDIGWANYKCSSCGECFVLESGTPQENEYNYCPNCGAKMDKN